MKIKHSGMYAGISRYVFGISAICMLIAVSAEANSVESIDIVVGQTEIIAYKNIERVSIGNADIADIKVLDGSNQVLMIGKKTGVTDVRLWGKGKNSAKYIIRIVEPSATFLLNRVKEHLGDIHGVSARIVDGAVIIEGRISREEDAARIQTLASSVPNVVSYVTKSEVNYKSMVRLDVRVLEFKKRSLESLGIDWSQSVNGPSFGVVSDWRTNSLFRAGDTSGLTLGSGLTALTLDVGGTNAYFGMTSAIASVINLLVQNGHARLLAEPNLSCRSGGKAEFHVGGEIPYPTTTQDGGSNVQFKSYGILLGMEPNADADGYIATKIDVEISSIDPAVSVQGYPGMLTRKTTTELNVKTGQTMVLAGLLSKDGSETVSRVPGLSAIPILGELFKSKSFQSAQTELVILVTPTITGAESEANKADIRKYDELAETAEQSLIDGVMD